MQEFPEDTPGSENPDASEPVTPAAPGLQTVPNVLGLDPKEAETAVLQAGFQVQTKKAWRRDLPGEEDTQSGRIVQVIPAPGSQVPAGSQVLLQQKVNLKQAIILGLSALAIVAGIIALILSMRPEPIVPKENIPEVPKGPDPSKAVKPGSTNRAGGVLVVPTINKQQVNVGSALTPINISNRSPLEQKIYYYYVPLKGNTLDGIPEYDVTKDLIEKGKKIVRLEGEDVTLRSGEKATINGEVVGKPENGKSELYGAVIVELGRDDKSKPSDSIKQGVQVRINNIFRITATQILQFPGPRNKEIVPVQVRGVQQEDGIQFKIRAKNTGNVLAGHDRGVFSLRDSSGKIIFSRAIEGNQGILPGDVRDLNMSETPEIKGLNPGNYRATATLASEGRARAVVWNFRVAEDGKIPTPAARFAAVSSPYTPDENQGFSIVVEAENNGTKTYQPIADISVVRYGEEKVLQRKTLRLDRVEVGQRTRGSASFKGLAPQGNYEAVVQLRSEDNVALGQQVASILVGGPKKSSTADIRDWMSSHPIETLLLGAALVGLLVLIGYLIWRWLHNRKSR